MELHNIGTKSDFLLYLSGGRLNIRAVTQAAKMARKTIAADLRNHGIFVVVEGDERSMSVWSELDKVTDVGIAVKAGLESEGFTVAIPDDQQQYWQPQNVADDASIFIITSDDE
jgi:hypothetical protein